MLVTAEMIQVAKLAGACNVPYRVGTAIADVAHAHLAWAEFHMPAIAREIAHKFTIPGRRGDVSLALFSGSGYGDGDGSGYGSGSGYGDA